MKTKVFISGNSQAVRIPQAFRLETTVVNIEQTEDGLIIKPVSDVIHLFREGIEGLHSKFPDREPAEKQTRESW